MLDSSPCRFSALSIDGARYAYCKLQVNTCVFCKKCFIVPLTRVQFLANRDFAVSKRKMVTSWTESCDIHFNAAKFAAFLHFKLNFKSTFSLKTKILWNSGQCSFLVQIIQSFSKKAILNFPLLALWNKQFKSWFFGPGWKLNNCNHIFGEHEEYIFEESRVNFSYRICLKDARVHATNCGHRLRDAGTRQPIKHWWNDNRVFLKEKSWDSTG